MKKHTEKKTKQKFKERGEILINTNKGITLIALVITVIILLILAGISIGMLSGENGILGHVGNTKTQTDIAEEKEILQTATLATIGKSKYGDVTKEKLDSELNKYPGIERTEQTDKGIVVTFKSNRAYLVNSDGDVSSYSDITIGNLVVKDGNTILSENCKSVQLGKSLTINFEASISNGRITSITPNIAYTTAGEKSKTFTIVGRTSDGKEITKEYMVNLKGYYNIPEIKVGDFVKYNVEYEDALYESNNFNQNNGWRILKIANTETDIYDIDIISTGMPAVLNYECSVKASWWDFEDTTLKSYYSGLGTTNFRNHTTWSYAYSGYYLAYGLTYNFKKIIFNKGVPYEEYKMSNNQAYFKNINNINETLDTEQKVLNAFSDSNLTEKITNIRSVNASDIKEDFGKVITNTPKNIGEEGMEDKAIGLFNLGEIKNLDKNIGNYTVYDGYLLATPNRK